MLIRLLILFTVVPLVELLILLRIAEEFDWPSTIGLVIVTGVIGASLARHEGFKVFGRIQAGLASGVPPAGELVEGLLILVAGVVLVTPGILTDICGFALLIPPVRRLVARRLTGYFKKRIVAVRHGPHDAFDDQFIDVSATGTDVNETPDD